MKVLISLEALNIILFAVSLGFAIADKNPTAACGWFCAILWCGLNFIKTIENEKTE